MSTKRTTTTREYTVPRIAKLLSFVAVILMGLGITIGVVLGKWVSGAAGVGNWIKSIAIAIGMIVLCWYSYYEARRHGFGWFIVWIIAVVLIVVFYVLGIVL